MSNYECVHINVCIIINITPIIILCIYLCISFILGILPMSNSYELPTSYCSCITVQPRKSINIQVHVLAICYVYITTIIIMCTYLPLYIFHLSILHISNSIYLKYPLHSSTTSKVQLYVAQCMHYSIIYASLLLSICIYLYNISIQLPSYG